MALHPAAAVQIEGNGDVNSILKGIRELGRIRTT
uniref:Uncharacterized protein n=1 Tax=Arundo donax TaxID=35708 RepID=A0A0A9BSI8_ARUDO